MHPQGMQEQLPHGMLEATITGKTSERVFLGLPYLFDATTAGRPGQEIPLSTGRTCTKDLQGEWQGERKSCGAQHEPTRQDTQRMAMALLWVGGRFGFVLASCLPGLTRSDCTRMLKIRLTRMT